MNFQVKDFTTRRNFPGTTGNAFDLILHRYGKLERIPDIIFAGLLLIIALIPTAPQWGLTVALWFFFLLDWLLLAYLPIRGKSYGPAKPPVVLLAAFRLVPTLFPVPVFLALELLGTLLVIYGFWIEPHRIRLTRQLLQSPKWKSTRPLRLLHIGDLHVERLTSRELQLNSMIATLQPDVILFTGDFLNLSYLRDPHAWAALRTVIKEWNAPLGVYAVTGSPAVDLPDIIPDLVMGLPICLLDQDRITVQLDGHSFDLIGLSCTHKPFVDAPWLETLIQEDSDRFTVLLYHSPDLAPNAASLSRRSGIDLHLAGHTHGGQVRLPLIGALYTGSLYGKQFEAGRYGLGELTLYITRGVGLEGAAAPRVRFLCPPEVVLWEIISEQDTREGQPSADQRAPSGDVL